MSSNFKDSTSQRIWTASGPIIVDQNGKQIEESKENKLQSYDAGKEENYSGIPVSLMQMDLNCDDNQINSSLPIIKTKSEDQSTFAGIKSDLGSGLLKSIS